MNQQMKEQRQQALQQGTPNPTEHHHSTAHATYSSSATVDGQEMPTFSANWSSTNGDGVSGEGKDMNKVKPYRFILSLLLFYCQQSVIFKHTENAISITQLQRNQPFFMNFDSLMVHLCFKTTREVHSSSN